MLDFLCTLLMLTRYYSELYVYFKDERRIKEDGFYKLAKKLINTNDEDIFSTNIMTNR